MTDRFETLAVHAGAEPDPHTGAVVPAIQMSTTFKQDGVGGLRGGFEYGRSGNPTRAALEEAIATLEDATHGVAFASGLAATQGIGFLLEPGDRLLMSDDVYGGTWRLADKVWRRYGIETDAIDLRDLDAVAAAFAGDRPPRMVWIETPSNPLLKVIDISAVARLAAVAGAITVVDNTFATPYLQRPLELRRRPRPALGDEVPRRPFRRHRRADRDALRRARRAAALPPERRRRGAEPVRLLPRHARPADAGACAWSAHRPTRWSWPCGCASVPRWSACTIPGCRTIRPRTSWRARCALPGAMLSIELRGGEAAARRFVAATRLFTLAESLGAVESLIELPGADDPRLGRRFAAGRAAVAGAPLASGIESVDDLRADLEAAFPRPSP